MALFGSYVKPGVYTQVVVETAGQPLFGNARIPVVIGEGTQFTTRNNVELFRGSSSNQDDQAVNENISNQVTGLTNTFQVTYYPIVDGTGKGIVTTDPSKVQVTSIDVNGNQIPVTVISVNGTTGQFVTQVIPPAGTELYVSYFFKRGDTQVFNEDLSAQIPQYATLTVTPSGGNSLPLSLQNPGELGNLVTLQFVAGVAVPDALAVSGIGTDAIVINITTSSGTRTLTNLVSLISAGIATLDGGDITTTGVITGVGSTALVAGAAMAFSGGIGQSTNTVFKVKNTPITDGTNGGVTTTNPANVSVLAGGSPNPVVAVDGTHGLITVANPVPYGSTLTATYFYNTWQNTFDLLPAANVASIVEVGYGPNRSDFVEDTDYTLGVDANGSGTINWGPSVSEAIGVSAAGELANFTPAEVLASLVAEQVFLRPVIGSVNSKNAVFTLQDTPTTGAGISTDNPALIQVYVGSDPLEAFLNGAVPVIRLSGAAQTITLKNPPTIGNSVYASYYRNTLATHEYTVQVVTPGYGTAGTFTITDELNRIAPLVIAGSNSVAAANFATTGIVYPYGFPDAQATAGAAVDETITLSFNNDGASVTVPAVQATKTITFTGGSLTFTASTPGVLGNNVTIAIDATTLNTVPVVVNGNAVTIFANWTGTLETGAQVAAHFPSALTLDGGAITASVSSTPTIVTTAATNLASGSNAVLTPTTHSYTVSSSIGANGSSGVGYLDQTYIDVKTGFRVTIVNPADHASYGVPSIPGSYSFTPGSTATITNVSVSLNVLTIDATNGFVPGQRVTLSGLTTATFLNGQTVVIATSTGSLFTAPFTHADYPAAADTGTATGAADTLQFVVKADAVGGAQPALRNCGTPGVSGAQANNLIAIPGLHTTVISNYQSTAGDTVIISTFRGTGNDPSIGQFYYVTFTVNKTTADYGLKIYTNPSDAYAAYGTPNTVNRLSLGIQFLTLNGTQTFAAIQVPVIPGTNQASDEDFINAIQSLALALPGSEDRHVDVVAPLSTSTTVHQVLSRFLTTQAAPRVEAEAIGFVGYDQFTSSNQARQNAIALDSERMIAIGNPVAGVLITDPLTGVSIEYPVSGEFMACALAGLNCNPANDVATTLTFQNVVGFTQLKIRYDDPTMDLMAADGLTLLVDNAGALKVRHYKTTRPENPIYSEPTCTTAVDYTRQLFRADNEQFIGRKLVDSLVADITVVCNARLVSLVNQQILSGYKNLSVVPDATDPTTVNVSVDIKPMFSLLYINVTFSVTTTL
jgi:hypothetical protein